MIEIKGKINTAKCFADEIDEIAYGQILAMCNEKAFENSKIRIMPDVHAGSGCTIGTTMTVCGKVAPDMVGVDIGCGMETVRIAQKDVDFERLDRLIREQIPCGREIRKSAHPLAGEAHLQDLLCADQVNISRAEKSIGTLGGGNHFIELDRDGEGNIYLVIHSGSRRLGREVAEYYQDQGVRAIWNGARYQIAQTIEKMKAEGRHSEIQSTLAELKKEHPINIAPELVCVEGKLFDDYIHDMKIMQNFAYLNRRAMSDVIIKGMGFEEVERFTTTHNYIDTERMILRKGSVSAQRGEKLLIPINMRDGSLICVGKGNEDWNCSAPHGAGRKLSRSAAFRQLSVDQYKEEMQGIWSSCVGSETLDESPMAYKDMADIVKQIQPTAEIICRILPIYNFKASE